MKISPCHHHPHATDKFSVFLKQFLKGLSTFAAPFLLSLWKQYNQHFFQPSHWKPFHHDHPRTHATKPRGQISVFTFLNLLTTAFWFIILFFLNSFFIWFPWNSSLGSPISPVASFQCPLLLLYISNLYDSAWTGAQSLNFSPQILNW